MQDNANNLFDLPFSASLSYHPIEYLPPKQAVISFSAPFSESFPYEKITAIEEEDGEELTAIPDDFGFESDDLQYVKFKKPAMKLGKGNKPITDDDSVSLLNSFERSLLELLPQVSKKDYIKPPIKVKRIKLIGNIDSEEVRELEEGLIRLESGDPGHKRSNSESTFDYNKRTKLEEIKSDGSSPAPAMSNSSELVDYAEKKVNTLLDELSPDADLRKTFTRPNGDEISLLKLSFWHQIRENISRLWHSDAVCRLDVENLLALEHEAQSTLDSINSVVNWKSQSSLTAQLAHISMESATVLLMLLTSSIGEKRMYKETFLTSVFTLIHDLQDSVLPLYSSSTTSVHPGVIKSLHDLSELLNMIVKFLLGTRVNDSLITRLEYFAFAFIFADTPKYDDTALAVNLEKLRVAGSSLLLTIAKQYPEQSQFIVSEIFANFDSVSHLKARSRQFRLSRGINVQLISILLVRLVQNTDCMDYSFDETYWRMTGSKVSSRKSQKEVVQQMTNDFYSYLEQRSKHADGVANEIAAAMATRMSLSFNQNVRKVFENLVHDLLNMLNYPEYPGCEAILCSMMIMLLHVCYSEDGYQSSLQSFAFEISGIIGSSLMRLKEQRTHSLSRDFALIHSDHLQVLYYLRENVAAIEDNSFSYLYMKYLSRLRKTIKGASKTGDNTAPLPLVKKLENASKSLIQVLNDNLTVLNSNSSSNILSSYHEILLTGNLIDQYDPFISLITRNLSNKKIKSQSVAIKNLSLLVSNDPSILKMPTVRRILATRLKESHASVCDAILDLLSKFLNSHVEMIPLFYSMISEKVSDTSVSVRRKAISLCSYIYRSTHKVEIRAKISEQLLKRLDDEEDTITFQACKSLLDSWFVSINDLYGQSLEDTGISLKDEVLSTVAVIVQVFNEGDRNWTYFERLLKEKVLMRNDLNEGIDDQLLKAISLMVEYILEYATEDAIIMMEDDGMKRKVGDIMGFLAIIIGCDSSFIHQDQLLALQPYLTDELSTGNSLCYHTLQIFHLALPRMTNLNSRFISECQESILTRLTRFNSRELDEAMPCLWSLSTRSRTIEIVTRACISSLRLMRLSMGKSVDARKLHRLLYLIGSFGRYCNLESYQQLFLHSRLGMKDNESVTSLLVRHILVFCDENNKELQKPAIRNLVGICVSHPELFMSISVLAIMDDIFSKLPENLELRGIIVDGISFFLEEEEKNVVERNGLDAKHSKKKTLDVAAFHGESAEYINDSICASLVQRYLKPILQGSIDTDQDFTLKATRYVRLVVRLGYANPKLCFPTVVALEASPYQYIRHVASQVHRSLFERHESLIEGAYPRALKLAVRYKRKFMPLKDMIKDKVLIRNILKIVDTANSGRKRIKFLKYLVGTFKVVNVDHLIEKSNVETCLFVRDYVIFMAFNLYELSYKTQEEILLVMNECNRVISSEIPDILEAVDECNDDIGRKMALKLGSLAKALLILCYLGDSLRDIYSLPEKALIKYQESSNVAKEFKSSPKRVEDGDLDIENLDLLLNQSTNEKELMQLCDLLSKYV
ncbi:hypothetical protein FOA43_004558 [Brettanomyces nanus]|uniref:Sister chromatid cohesion protein n=1 Tax=Eeniella nana TaxID=13502 RepID=A0A875S8D7_EENNA|nr:uncharacterized protein FOA43_004558 [Brettanomyces nanus]QPG77153.1 hypothetical protein FOA43_004558 [Brettanomyces nanus]